jgi:hypothetical protein
MKVYKLSALLFLVGYMALAGLAFEYMMTALIKERGGRVVDSPGDNLLAEVSSVGHAVECAVEIQRELRERNAELPETRRLEYRIGVNLGDVIEEGDTVLIRDQIRIPSTRTTQGFSKECTTSGSSTPFRKRFLPSTALL